MLRVVPIVKLVLGHTAEIDRRNQDTLCHHTLPLVDRIIADPRCAFQAASYSANSSSDAASIRLLPINNTISAAIRHSTPESMNASR
jgi:hypothetical protein